VKQTENSLSYCLVFNINIVKSLIQVTFFVFYYIGAKFTSHKSE